jgi:hypothetical protein
MVQQVLRWERQDMWSGRKRQGPMTENYSYIALFIKKNWEGFNIQLFPLGQANKAHFTISMCYNESTEASMPSMCHDHIIAHKTYHIYLALPLKPAPTCFTKERGTSRTREFEYTWWSRLQIMLNVQHKVHVTCNWHWTCTNKIAYFFG